jgi:hypothetical protein
MIVTLFFGAADGSGLVREAREIDTCTELPICINDLIVELAAGPLGDLGPTLPDNSVIRSVTIDGATAIVDLARDTVNRLPSGSSSESLAAYSIVNSICYNFPQIKQVQFLVDGGKQQTLKDHLDVRKPVQPNMAFEKATPQS